MKIVVTGTRGIPNIMGGVETHCEELFPRMVRRGFDVTVIRRSNYVKDNLTEWNGVRLVDIESPKKKSFEAMLLQATQRRRRKISAQASLRPADRKLSLFYHTLSPISLITFPTHEARPP